MFFKFVLKAWIAVYLLSHTFDISMAIFDVAQHVVSNSSSIISENTSVDVSVAVETMRGTLEGKGIAELFIIWIETGLLSIIMKGVSIAITIILYGRMMEIYIYSSVAPIPFATLTNREWGSIGNNYIKALIAIAFQGFFIMVIVGIYAVLLSNVTLGGDFQMKMFELAAYTLLLLFMLFKTHGISKSIFNAH